ncbi:helix-turn-helix domain-containing protein [Pectobacterium aroidearum]|uniref:helix-turn-helix domain-containing protein n=1 Tax=Pectobacterium aroidearum TaxID=1201031 RepID=UPI003315AA8A
MPRPKIRNEEVGARIFERRKMLGITQGDVAEKLQVSSAAISLWEKGKAIPTSEKLYNLADILQCEIDWLLMGKGAKPNTYGSSPETGLTKEEIQLLDLFNRIPKSERPKILDMIKIRIEEYDKLFQELLETRGRQDN